MLKRLLRDGNGFMKIDFEPSTHTLRVRLDRSKILSHEKPALGRMLLRLHVYRSTADMAACRPYYEGLSRVDGEYLEWGKAVVSQQQPKWVFVQTNTWEEHGRVILKECPPTNIGVIQIWAERGLRVIQFLSNAIWMICRTAYGLSLWARTTSCLFVPSCSRYQRDLKTLTMERENRKAINRSTSPLWNRALKRYHGELEEADEPEIQAGPGSLDKLFNYAKTIEAVAPSERSALTSLNRLTLFIKFVDDFSAVVAVYFGASEPRDLFTKTDVTRYLYEASITILQRISLQQPRAIFQILDL